MEERLRLNKEGYKQYQAEIEKKEAKLAKVRMYKGTDAIYQGDNWHDNPILYQTERTERSMMNEIAEMKRKLENAEIVEDLNDEELVEIGDIVRVDMIFGEGDTEEDVFRLVSTNLSADLNAEIRDVSINSPMGSAIYRKKVGITVPYKVGQNEFKVTIKEKIKKVEDEAVEKKLK